jgi:hypothetical protein
MERCSDSSGELDYEALRAFLHEQGKAAYDEKVRCRCGLQSSYHSCCSSLSPHSVPSHPALSLHRSPSTQYAVEWI